MKMKVLFIVTTLALLAIPVSNGLISSPLNHAQDQCTPENRQALYAEFLKMRTTDQPKAFDLAKKYLACAPTGQATEPEQKIIDYLKKFSSAYETALRKIRLRVLLYDERKYVEAYELGRQVLATERDNLKVLVDLGANGYLVAPFKNAQLTNEAAEYAKRALQLIESGKTVDDWAPLANKDIAVAYLNYTIGTLALEKDPSAALKHLINAVQFETPLKKSPYTYAYIAGAYETGPYAKLSAQYTNRYSNQDESQESKLMLANINQLVDRIIDAYGRAVALAGNGVQFAKPKAAWLESLTTFYKYRHNDSDTGLSEFITTVLGKPLPPLMN